MDFAAAVRAGFAGIDAAPALKDKAAAEIATWLTHPDYTAYRPQIEWLIQQQKWSLLLDSFYQIIPFGTGGRRGSVGVGPNRMNLWSIGASVQGHCEYLKQRFPGAAVNVVLAYDVRKFMDQRGNYNPQLPNPVFGLTSRNFCEYAAGVYAANGITAHILPPDSTRYVSTPELSFTIRYLKAHGGLNMTASHNPPDDNGCKFYEERGAQPVPPDDQLIMELVDQVEHIKTMPWADAVKAGRVKFLDVAAHDGYIDLCRKQSLVPPPKQNELRVVFTPLHGVGHGNAGEALEAAGFKLHLVAEQSTPDGRFPNVTKQPNPEVPECLDRAEKLAQEIGADVVIATDPDADRLGGLACTTTDGKGPFRFLSGQEIAALLTHFKLSRLQSAGDMPASPVVITTEVTTGQITRIARHFGAQVVNDLLVGFKYHADVLWHLEQHGQYGEVKGTPADFVIASEESHGYLTTAHIRDKDAGGAALLLAELALHLKRQGRTIPELIADLNRQFGYFKNELQNLVMTGLEGKQNMAKMLDALRRNPPKQVAGMTVTSVEDLQREDGKLGPWKGETDKAGRNFLIFRLNGGGLDAKVCLRPSGTEPKAKAYIEVCGPAGKPELADAVNSQIKALSAEFLQLALAAAGQ